MTPARLDAASRTRLDVGMAELYSASFAQFVVRRGRFCPPPARLDSVLLAALKEERHRTQLATPTAAAPATTMPPTVGARPYKCSVPGCTSLFGKANHLSRHIRIVHNKERPFRCEFSECNSRFGSRSHLVDHVNAVHKRLRNFRCERCNAAFSKSFNLAKYVRTRSSPRSYHILTPPRFHRYLGTNASCILKSQKATAVSTATSPSALAVISQGMRQRCIRFAAPVLRRVPRPPSPLPPFPTLPSRRRRAPRSRQPCRRTCARTQAAASMTAAPTCLCRTPPMSKPFSANLLACRTSFSRLASPTALRRSPAAARPIFIFFYCAMRASHPTSQPNAPALLRRAPPCN